VSAANAEAESRAAASRRAILERRFCMRKTRGEERSEMRTANLTAKFRLTVMDENAEDF
jgi:hypothetical protein